MIGAELKKLAQHSAIYGVADVVPYLVNFLLLPVFTTYLTPADYGALSILLLFGVLTKIFFRSGFDSGFSGFTTSKRPIATRKPSQRRCS